MTTISLLDLQALPLTGEAKSKIQKSLNKLSFNKDQTIFHQGEVCTSLYFIRSGLVKLSYITTEGKELIKSFIAEGGMFGSLYSQLTGEGSTFNATALEDLAVDVLDYTALIQAGENSLEMQKIFVNFFQQLALSKEMREYEFLCLSAQQRYKKFCEQYPQIVSRIRQADLALYLGITPIALSRLKHRSSGE
ncbi:MAG: Crp/Fnr family transcriptional regulator [Gammaproteobacteria bacterium]|nr:Crp/Fnr family transcriptional regulator [Gammaproteobacteria bacterium]MDH5730448.1 Crp/Fnr family transcriptional regulator [Gammaproteobacteria bacterium]